MSVSNGFDRNLALFLADCCIEAYNQFRYKGNFNIPQGYKLINVIKAAPAITYDLFGFIIESEDSIVIAFRGSQSNPDWIADAAILQSYFPYTRIKLKTHAGFTSIYNTCRNDIINTLDALDTSKKLFITGHSLGGALAVLNALDTAANTHFANPVMYNFGSPRVGNPKFVYTYNEAIKNSFRIVNVNDIIPLLPPVVIRPPLSNEIWYYRHVKEVVTISVQTGSIHGNHLVESYAKGLEML